MIISTGVSNWAHEVTEAEGSLAFLLSEAHRSLSKKPPIGADVSQVSENQLSAAVAAIRLTPEDGVPTPSTPSMGKNSGGREKKEGKKDTFPAIFDISESTRLIINNGSFKSASDDQDRLTAIVLPDFKYVNEIRETNEDAERLWCTTLDPSIKRAGRKILADGATPRDEFRTRPLPYDSVVLICECVCGFVSLARAYVIVMCIGSHKRRDNRCGIAAPILEEGAEMSISSKRDKFDTPSYSNYCCSRVSRLGSSYGGRSGPFY